MSKIRKGTCGEPGPYNAHCTDYIGHRYSCYDAGEDVSWNDGMEWRDDVPHECDDSLCHQFIERQHNPGVHVVPLGGVIALATCPVCNVPYPCPTVRDCDD